MNNTLKNNTKELFTYLRKDMGLFARYNYSLQTDTHIKKDMTKFFNLDTPPNNIDDFDWLIADKLEEDEDMVYVYWNNASGDRNNSFINMMRFLVNKYNLDLNIYTSGDTKAIQIKHKGVANENNNTK